MKNIELKWMRLNLFILLAAVIFPASCTKDKNLPIEKKPVIKFYRDPDPVIPRNHIDTPIYKKVTFPNEIYFTKNRN